MWRRKGKLRVAWGAVGNSGTSTATSGWSVTNPPSTVASLPPRRRASSASHASVTCAGPLSRSVESVVLHLSVAEALVPKLAARHRVDRIEFRPCRRHALIHSEPHVQTQQCPLCHRARRERLTHRIGPQSRPLVMDVRINRQRHEQIPIEQPRHASPSIRATSSAEKGSLPVEIGKPRALCRRISGRASAEIAPPRKRASKCRYNSRCSGVGSVAMAFSISASVLMPARSTLHRAASTRPSRRTKGEPRQVEQGARVGRCAFAQFSPC